MQGNPLVQNSPFPNTIDKDELHRSFTERPFSVQMLLRNRMEPGETAEYRTTYSALIFTLRGRARLSFDGQVFDASPQVVIHGCPGRLLRFKSDPSEGFEHLNIYYTACQVDTASLASGPWMNIPFAFQMENYAAVTQQVAELEGLNNQPSLDNRLNQIAGSTILIKNLFAPAKKSNAKSLDRVRHHIDSHYNEPMSLTELGELAGMSPKHLSRCFSCNYGVSPMNYLVARRLERAQFLLTSGMRVYEAAAMVGYDDPFYFSRLFKKHYGYPPQKLKPQRT
jgi:AraC-like DNA-binding protein